MILLLARVRIKNAPTLIRFDSIRLDAVIVSASSAPLQALATAHYSTLSRVS